MCGISFIHKLTTCFCSNCILNLWFTGKWGNGIQGLTSWTQKKWWTWEPQREEKGKFYVKSHLHFDDMFGMLDMTGLNTSKKKRHSNCEMLILHSVKLNIPNMPWKFFCPLDKCKWSETEVPRLGNHIFFLSNMFTNYFDEQNDYHIILMSRAFYRLTVECQSGGHPSC